MAVAGAYSTKVPLYRHVAKIAGSEMISLPLPALNIINGGSHAGNLIAFQEFMIVPTGASSFKEAMQMGSEIYHHLKGIIKKRFGQDGNQLSRVLSHTSNHPLLVAINVGDEGGFAPNISSITECLDLIVEAISVSGYETQVKIALDVAASGTLQLKSRLLSYIFHRSIEFYSSEGGKGYYNLDNKNSSKLNPQKLSGKELADLYIKLARSYPSKTFTSQRDKFKLFLIMVDSHFN